MITTILQELLHFGVVVAAGCVIYCIASALERRRHDGTPRTTEPEPTDTDRAYTAGQVLGYLILVGLGTLVLSALAALTILLWRAVL